LLLSEKQDGNLYTQEEVEIARASCERLIDLLAGEELSRRLMALQRRRLAETQVMDRQTRRALHDEILPDLHTAILGLSSQCEGNLETQKAIGILSKAHRQIADLIRIPPTIAFNPLQAGGFIEALRQAVQSEFGGEFDAIHWRSEGEVPELDPLTAEVVFHAVREAVRNAALHGRGADREHPLSVNLSIQAGEALTIRVTDNGVGIPRSENGWDQSPGGLTLHSTLLAIVGGSLSSVPDPEGGTTVTIGVPLPRLAGSRTA
jgi:signal transduction histidine kinase